MGPIIACIIAVILIVWLISCRHRLAVMEEDTDNAMAQIGIQLSLRYDALTGLLELAGEYDANESQTLIETVKSRQSAISAASVPKEVLKQEEIISKTLSRISMVAEHYPQLKANGNYAKYMNAMDSYGRTVQTSRLIYNDSVTKLNRELRMFPASLLAGILGLQQRDYLEAPEDRAGNQ